MKKKISYNQKTHEELILELAKFKEELRSALLEKKKTGKAVAYRTARKNIARVLTALQLGK